MPYFIQQRMELTEGVVAPRHLPLMLLLSGDHLVQSSHSVVRTRSPESRSAFPSMPLLECTAELRSELGPRLRLWMRNVTESADEDEARTDEAVVVRVTYPRAHTAYTGGAILTTRVTRILS